MKLAFPCLADDLSVTGDTFVHETSHLMFRSYILSVLLRSETPDISHKTMDTLQSEQATSYGNTPQIDAALLFP